MNTHFFSDTSVMLRRSLRHVTRSMDTIVTVTIMPIAFMLLFVYVFGGAIHAGTDSYVSYLLPGILLIAIASGISYTAYRLFITRGLIDSSAAASFCTQFDIRNASTMAKRSMCSSGTPVGGIFTSEVWSRDEMPVDSSPTNLSA